MKKVGIAIIGAGIGKNGFGLGSYILEEVLQHPNAEVLAIAGTSDNKIKEKLSSLAISNVLVFNTENIIDLFKIQNLDLVIICSPDFTHLKYLELAVKFGKNVLVEKPIVEINGNWNDVLLDTISLANSKGLLISTLCQRVFVSEYFGINSVRNQIKIELTVGRKHRDIEVLEFFKLVISHPASILIKLGIDDVDKFIFVEFKLDSEGSLNHISIDFNYNKTIIGKIILRQNDIEGMAELALVVDQENEIRVSAEKIGNSYKTRYVVGESVQYGNDLLSNAIIRMIDAVYDPKNKPFISNFESEKIHKLENLIYQNLLNHYPKKLPSVSVFIPIYNSEKYILNTVTQTYVFLENNFEDFELVLCDDSSKDDTLKVLNSNARLFPKARIISNIGGPSKRENLGKAMMTAKFDLVFFQDQDLAVPFEFIIPLISKITEENYDISIGSRYMGLPPVRSFQRLFFSKLYNFGLNFFFNTNISDHICGFKAFRKDKLIHLLTEMGYDSSKKRGWFWDAELLIHAKRLNLKIIELPVKWVSKYDSTVRIAKEFGMLFYIIDFKIRSISKKNI